ncbi:MAG TPA: amidohydrolase family protein [Polyangiaceae bacterium]|nr:amidohydrolase family protein [Polyangiaceae bacterium]
MKRWSYLLLPLLTGATYVAACSDGGTPGTTEDGGTTPVVDGSTPPPTDGAKPDPDGGKPDGSPPGSGASCLQTKTGTKGVVLKGTVLLPETIAEAGEVFYDADKILCAGPDCSTTAGYAAASVITCTNAVISPGLINAHDHISFANNPPKGHGTERFEHRHDWRKGIRGHKKISVAGSASTDIVRFAELRFIMSGATSTAGAGGAANLMRNLDSSAAQLEGLGTKLVDSDTFPLKDSDPPSTLVTACASYPTTRRTTASIDALDGYLPHISEGIDDAAHAEMTCQSDATTPHNLLQKQTGVVHGIAVTPAQVAKHRDAQTALVWSPRSNVDLYGDTAAVAMYDNLGVQIALGTDWVASGSMNMSRELRCADELNQKYFNKHFTDKALWKMVTQNAAFATGIYKVAGMLKAGYVSDISIFDASKSKGYRAVIDAGVEDTLLVIRGGKPLYGNAAVLDLAAVGGGTCEALDVCGVPKKACVELDTNKGTTLAKIRTAGEAIYPLFFCKDKVPTNEPSCVPYRASYTAGITATDKDGDGVPDATDNCPSVFNPPRPMSGATQADADNDNIGDACDKCPLTTGESCTPPSADDIDGDGTPNGVDPCPELANATDCRPPPPPSTLVTATELRDPAAAGHPALGTQVRVESLYVTALRTADNDKGFYVQINSTAPMSGFFVSTGTVLPTVAIGNQVTIEGKYAETFGVTTVTNPIITVVTPSTTLPFSPVVVTSADYAVDATAEPFEGMLCQINAAQVSITNPDAPNDYGETQLDGVLRMDDACYPALDNVFAVGTAFPKVVGICGYSFSQRKIWPRSGADLL